MGGAGLSPRWSRCWSRCWSRLARPGPRRCWSRVLVSVLASSAGLGLARRWPRGPRPCWPRRPRRPRPRGLGLDASASGGLAAAATGASSATGSATGSAGVPAPPRRTDGSSSALARSASTRRAVWASGAANSATAPDSDAFMAPASLASSTSRDSRSASFLISSAVRDLPSITPPLITRSGLALAKSRRPLAASTGSPLTKAIADGPDEQGVDALDPGVLGRDLGERVLDDRVGAWSNRASAAAP